MKRIIFCYIGLLCGIIVGMIFLQISGTFEKSYYTHGALPGYSVLKWIHNPILIRLLLLGFWYLLFAVIQFTIMGGILLIFIKMSGWQIPCSKIKNMEIGFFYAFLWIAGELNVRRFFSLGENFLWRALHSHLPFAPTIFAVLEYFNLFIYSFIIFLLVVIVDYWVLVKAPSFSIKR